MFLWFTRLGGFEGDVTSNTIFFSGTGLLFKYFYQLISSKHALFYGNFSDRGACVLQMLKLDEAVFFILSLLVQ